MCCRSRTPSCLVPAFDGALFSIEWKEALWARFCTAAPQRRRQSVEAIQHSQTDIHRMTGLLGLRLAQTGSIGETELRQMASAIGQGIHACSLRAGNVDFAFIRA